MKCAAMQEYLGRYLFCIRCVLHLNMLCCGCMKGVVVSWCECTETHWEQTPATTMPSSAEAKKLERISMDLKHVSLKREQLEDRKQMLTLLLKFRKPDGNSDGGSTWESDIDTIDAELEELSQRKLELHRHQQEIEYSNVTAVKKEHFKEDIIISTQSAVPGVLESYMFVEPPPSITAPTVILDTEQLPPYPTKTQCPECRQFVTTEVLYSVGSVTWLACVMTVMIGGVAGCCLIPFCTDSLKDLTHKCPKCRSNILIIKKL